jgi:hypothetical protein
LPIVEVSVYTAEADKDIIHCETGRGAVDDLGPSQLLCDGQTAPCGIRLTHPATINQSSSPNAPLMIRIYVLKETVMIERPKKTVDKTRMARGKPSGVMVLAVGSPGNIGIDIFPSLQCSNR